MSVLQSQRVDGESRINTLLESFAGGVTGAAVMSRESTWVHERLLIRLRWRDAVSGEAVCELRFQYSLRERLILIGHLEITSNRRNQGLGKHLVSCLERGARVAGIRKIRLYSRRTAAGFWKRIGYRQEYRSVFMIKEIG